MLPELWSSIRRLLLCSIQSDSSTECVISALEQIEQALPNVEIKWLFLDTDNHYHLISELNAIPFSDGCISTSAPLTIINALQAANFDATIVLTAPGQSPYHLAYLCYLAGIPIRVGQSKEFGGGVLSHCIQPPLDPLSPLHSSLHLLHTAGLIMEPAIASPIPG